MTEPFVTIARGVWLDLWARLRRRPSVEEFAAALGMSRRAAYRYLARFDAATKTGRDVVTRDPYLRRPWARPAPPVTRAPIAGPKVHRIGYVPPAGSIALALLGRDRVWSHGR